MLIRAARAEDVRLVEELVDRAFARYVVRIGRPPAPMAADYGAHERAGHLSVAVDDDGVLAGMIVLIPHPGHLLIDVLAVDPDRQGEGIGRLLILSAEDRARALGCRELRLYTNAKMTENLVFYPRRGFLQTGRETVNGFERVFFVKRLT